MQTLSPITPLEAGVEMFQRAKTQSFLAPRTSYTDRPVSEATEFLDTDIDDGSHSADESEFEEDSPRDSFNSYGYRSQTTISTFEEVTTPRSAHQENFNFDFGFGDVKPVEGPRGPHLFRSSQSSADFDFKYALQMSPLSPKQPPSRVETAFKPTPITSIPLDTLLTPATNADRSAVRNWSSREVAEWMHASGFEGTTIDKFQLHDITGAVLLDMQFEDLKELDIRSFGKRHRVWNEIQTIRNSVENGFSPTFTSFEDTSRPCTAAAAMGATRSRSKSCNRRVDMGGDEACTPNTDNPAGGRRRKGRKPRRSDEEIVTPAESVSIVAIEQLLPKPHRCARGERCAKWRRQQRQMAALHDEHGFPISPEKGGKIFVAGNPGNAQVAKNVVENVHLRPNSDAVPSVVASSDVLGPGPLPTLQALQDVESRDPQENVKQFLTLQGLNVPPPAPAVESPPTPPLEMFPPMHTQSPLPQNVPPPPEPHVGLRGLPRLSIPRSSSAGPVLPKSASAMALEQSTFSPCRTATVSPALAADAGLAPYFQHMMGMPDRYDTPASEMDVPVTAVDMGPIQRNVSQSVPPNMQYNNSNNSGGSMAFPPPPPPPPHGRSGSRRPSFAMPALAEDAVFSPQTTHAPALSRANTQRSTRSNTSGTSTVFSGTSVLKKSHRKSLSSASVSTTSLIPSQKQEEQEQKYQYANAQHAGWMRKRRTRLLRHEWTPAHFRLTGTQLAMHRDEQPSSQVLSTIDVDDYAVACSALASGKLAAKLKALKLSGHGLNSQGNGGNNAQNGDGNGRSRGSGEHKRDEGKTDPAAFSFQLVPSSNGSAVYGDGHGQHNNQRNSNTDLAGGDGNNISSGSSTGNGNGNKGGSGSSSGLSSVVAKAAGAKTHHFAVKSRDDRIEWMRELMLAKALKAKGEGYEVKVNGSAV